MHVSGGRSQSSALLQRRGKGVCLAVGMCIWMIQGSRVGMISGFGEQGSSVDKSAIYDVALVSRQGRISPALIEGWLGMCQAAADYSFLRPFRGNPARRGVDVGVERQQTLNHRNGGAETPHGTVAGARGRERNITKSTAKQGNTYADIGGLATK